MAPVLIPFRMLVSAPAFRWLASYRAETPEGVDADMLAEVRRKVLDVLQGGGIVLSEQLSEQSLEGLSEEVSGQSSDETSREVAGVSTPDDEIADRVVERLAQVLTLPDVLKRSAATATSETYAEAVRALLREWRPDDWEVWGALFGWVFTHALGGLVNAEAAAEISRDWFDAWLLRKPVAQALEGLGVADDARERTVATVRLLLTAPDWMFGDAAASHGLGDDLPTMLRRALAHRDVHAYLGVNRYEGVLWYNREAFGRWLWWMLCIVALRRPELGDDFAATLAATYGWMVQLQIAEETSGYQVARLLEAVEELNAA